MTRLSVLLGLFSGLMLAALLGGGVSASEIKLGGTGGDLGTMRMIADAYEAQTPGAKVTVFPSLGSGGGIRAVIDGAIDLSISSRPLKDKEHTAGARDFVYAKTALVVATAGRQTLPDLTTRRLVGLYLKQDGVWPDGRRVRFVLRPANDGDTKLLEKQIDGMAMALRAADKPGAIIGRTDQDAANALEKRPDAVGCLIPVSKSILAEPLFFPFAGNTVVSEVASGDLAGSLHHSALWLWPPNVLDAMADGFLSGLQPTWRDRLGHRPGWGRRFRDFTEPVVRFALPKPPPPFPASGTPRR